MPRRSAPRQVASLDDAPSEPYDLSAQPTIIEVRVKPRSGVRTLVQGEDGKWLAQLKAAPVAGKANQELIALVAAQFGCPKSAVTIKSGLSGRTKLVRIESR